MLDDVLDRVDIRLYGENPKAELLEELIQTATDRVLLVIDEDELPKRLASIVVDVTVKLYRRLYHEGISSESADTLNTSFVDNVLSEYEVELSAYRSRNANRKVVRFL